MASPLIPLPTLDEALKMPFGTLSKQEAGTFAALLQEATERLAAARKAYDLIQAALVFKYGLQARAERLALDMDAGVVQFDDNGVRITVDQPRRIEWNQAVLADIAAHMKAQGADPADFVDAHYSVTEAKYQAWSRTLQDDFVRARKVIYGSPLFHLDLLPELPVVTP